MPAPSQVMDNYQELLQELSIGPMNPHKPFWRALSSLTRCLGNFLGGQPSQHFSTTSILNDIVLKSELSKKKCIFGDKSSYFNPLKPHSGCYKRANPHSLYHSKELQ